MVSIGISEFSFGYAFLYEQTTRNFAGLKAAPILPSLYQEASLGWDAKLPTTGADFYYQFKLTDYLYRGNAAHIRSGLYDGPYFRIALYPRHNNRQHRRLKAWAAEAPNTFYVAPEVSSAPEFSQLFLRGEISEQSRLIPVRECREIDDGYQHYITFQRGRRSWNEHSEKQFHEDSILGSEISDQYRRTDFRPIDGGFAREILTKLKEVISVVQRDEALKEGDDGLADVFSDLPSGDLMEYDPVDQPTSEVLYRAGQLASILGTTMVIVGED